MSAAHPRKPSREAADQPPALHDRALQDLSFIRRTMEGAAAFTDVPGWGLVGVGAIGVSAAALAQAQPSPDRWLAAWLGAAVLAVTVGTVALRRKLRRRVGAEGSLLHNVPARKFFLSFVPAIVAGAVLTAALVDPFTPGLSEPVAARLLPGLWLLLYGVGFTTAGAFSVRTVPLMGMAFILLGVVALFVPALDGDLMMAVGFGGLHLVGGAVIARRHGG